MKYFPALAVALCCATLVTPYAAEPALVELHVLPSVTLTDEQKAHRIGGAFATSETVSSSG